MCQKAAAELTRYNSAKAAINPHEGSSFISRITNKQMTYISITH